MGTQRLGVGSRRTARRRTWGLGSRAIDRTGKALVPPDPGACDGPRRCAPVLLLNGLALAAALAMGSAPPGPLEPGGEEPPRLLVRDQMGREMVARLHGRHGGEIAVVLPDGRIARVDGQIYTDRPFQPATADALREELLNGPYQGFQVLNNDRYLVFYQSSERFATDSANLLETLYDGLIKAFRESGLAVHDAEFPLVAVIFATERAFRAHKPVAADVQAYYEIASNRIFFYETSDREHEAPEVAALRKPQTVAHEGTHQILQNIGVQPRLAEWPVWLVEGLAEYCAPVSTRRGAVWAGFGQVNPLHMATIHDLHDQQRLQMQTQGRPTVRIGRDPRMPMLPQLVTKTELSPTDYALVWALTHYLASRRRDDFLAYLKQMSQMPPLEPRSPEDHLKTFQEAFGPDLTRLERAMFQHLAQLRYDPLPYFAVLFEQHLGGVIERKALVSQSPSVIRQWLENAPVAQGGPWQWQAIRHTSRTRAMATARQWVEGL